MNVTTIVGAAIKAATVLLGVSIGKITIIPVLIVALMYFNYDLMDPENHPRVTKELKKSYDFIVIGGGSAGNVIVNRLTENPEWNVLLLEAGGHETEITDVPILSLYLHKSKVDWKYRTQPQSTACQAMVDHRCSWTRGKCSISLPIGFGESEAPFLVSPVLTLMSSIMTATTSLEQNSGISWLPFF
ncbi:glucose dehydrogenase [Lasius niger]|uniref:Glucose dehydrogenase n=1 Tax=Lasius niger TaxID=67767 RepID=A0A0J7KTB7_LASNI|nr:glucose dehydrogenase [Lasius niger]